MSAGAVSTVPPVAASVAPAASIDSVSVEMLNAVWYQRLRPFVFSVHCAHAPDTIIHNTGPVPNSSSDANPTAKPVDSVDDEVLSGRSIFSVCAAIEVSA